MLLNNSTLRHIFPCVLNNYLTRVGTISSYLWWNNTLSPGIKLWYRHNVWETGVGEQKINQLLCFFATGIVCPSRGWMMVILYRYESNKQLAASLRGWRAGRSRLGIGFTFNSPALGCELRARGRCPYVLLRLVVAWKNFRLGVGLLSILVATFLLLK